MKNKTVKELKQIAKERKIKYYYNLTKEDLVRALQSIPAPHSIVVGSGLFSRFKTTAINAVNHGFNRVLEVIDPYVPAPVKNVVRKTIKSLKGLVFSTPASSPVASVSSAPRPVASESSAPRPNVFKLTKHAVKNVARQYSYKVKGEDVSSFLNRVRDAALKILRENKNKKVYFVLKCEMSRLIILTGDELIEVVPFASKSGIVLEATDLGELYDIAKERILENMVNINSNGSNWKVSSILRMDINMINYNPLSASSWIELDKFIF